MHSPCADCLRWWECNGVDADRCPLFHKEENYVKTQTSRADSHLSGLPPGIQNHQRECSLL